MDAADLYVQTELEAGDAEPTIEQCWAAGLDYPTISEDAEPSLRGLSAYDMRRLTDDGDREEEADVGQSLGWTIDGAIGNDQDLEVGHGKA